MLPSVYLKESCCNFIEYQRTSFYLVEYKIDRGYIYANSGLYVYN